MDFQITKHIMIYSLCFISYASALTIQHIFPIFQHLYIQVIAYPWH